ncbi:MAG: enoyl-CoA hydratase/isomerase family protein [Halobacteriales archaeon]
MADPVSVDGGAVTTVTIDRREELNTLTPATLEALAAAVEEARDARAVVLTGAGDRAFAAGADVEYMRDLSTPEAQAYAELGRDVTAAIVRSPAPVIAAINGYAFGGGLELALVCDLRVASERAVLGSTEIDLGIIPGWGGTQRLPGIVGDETARRLVYFGERIDAQDALEHGLVGEVVAHGSLRDHAATLGADLAAKPRHALAAAKEAFVRRHRDGLEAGLAFERRAWSGLFGTHDQREGMAAFLEDREPEFE